jgi:hypothetical protein
MDTSLVPVTGALPVGAQIKVSLDGAAWVNGSGSWTENANGAYYYNATQSETVASSFLMLRVAWPGAKIVVFPVDIGDRVVISNATAAARRFPVYLEDSSGNAVPSQAFAGTDFQLTKNGAAFANCAGTLPEIGGVGLGLGGYYYEATVAEIDTLGYDGLLVDNGGTALPYFYVWNVIPVPPAPLPPPGVVIVALITPISTISKTTPVIIDVYSTAVPLRRAWVNASYAGLLPDDMVHNSDRFGAAYQGSTNVRSNITNGYRFTLLRDGGWPGTPSITVHAVDTLGSGDEP